MDAVECAGQTERETKKGVTLKGTDKDTDTDRQTETRT